jgi:hypothetical protein
VRQNAKPSISMTSATNTIPKKRLGRPRSPKRT